MMAFLKIGALLLVFVQLSQCLSANHSFALCLSRDGIQRFPIDNNIWGTPTQLVASSVPLPENMAIGSGHVFVYSDERMAIAK
jgi:hypothetical protein